MAYFYKFLRFSSSQNRKKPKNRQLAKGKGEIFSFFCQKTPRPPYVARDLAPFRFIGICSAVVRPWGIIPSNGRERRTVLRPLCEASHFMNGDGTCMATAVLLVSGKMARHGVSWRMSVAESAYEADGQECVSVHRSAAAGPQRRKHGLTGREGR